MREAWGFQNRPGKTLVTGGIKTCVERTHSVCVDPFTNLNVWTLASGTGCFREATTTSTPGPDPRSALPTNPNPTATGSHLCPRASRRLCTRIPRPIAPAMLGLVRSPYLAIPSSLACAYTALNCICDVSVHVKSYAQTHTGHRTSRS